MVNIVINTNVFISSLKPRRGASLKLLHEVLRNKFQQNISSTLIFEYESVANRSEINIKLTHDQIDSILDMLSKWSSEKA